MAVLFSSVSHMALFDVRVCSLCRWSWAGGKFLFMWVYWSVHTLGSRLALNECRKANIVFLMKGFYVKINDRLTSGSSISTLSHMNIAGCSQWIICAINHGFCRRKYSCPSLQWLQRQPLICVYKSQISNSATHSSLCLHFRSFLFVPFYPFDLWSCFCPLFSLLSNRARWLTIMVVWFKVGNGYNASLLRFLCIF